MSTVSAASATEALHAAGAARATASDHSFEFDPFGGRTVVARPARPSDLLAVGAMLTRLSPAARQRRFFSPIVRITPRVVRHLVEVDHVRHETLVALCGETVIGMAELVRSRDGPEDEAEVAVVVEDAYQRQGVARFLFRALARVARARGITTFVAAVQPSNRAALALAHALSRDVETRSEDGTISLRISLARSSFPSPPGADPEVAGERRRRSSRVPEV